jgi:hypothetical protein
MPVPLLPAFYFGSVEHYRLLARHEKVVIDTGEHYERQSYRTRTGILGPNGKQDLVVHIARRSGEKMPMHTVDLSYEETWPQQHLHAIRSAYGQTPWFIHYIDDIEATLTAKHQRLAELNLATLRLGMKWLGLRTEVFITEDYVVLGRWSKVHGPSGQALDLGPTTLDLRSTFQPKRSLPSEIAPVPSYPQVFADRHGFVPRLSLIDLMMNAGPEARRIIAA